jgi:hypothetical protein
LQTIELHTNRSSGRICNTAEKADERSKILALSSGTLLVYQLPDGVALDGLKFEIKDGSLSLTDGMEFTMNLAEHTHGGLV